MKKKEKEKRIRERKRGKNKIKIKIKMRIKKGEYLSSAIERSIMFTTVDNLHQKIDGFEKIAVDSMTIRHTVAAATSIRITDAAGVWR